MVYDGYAGTGDDRYIRNNGMECGDTPVVRQNRKSCEIPPSKVKEFATINNFSSLESALNSLNAGVAHYESLVNALKCSLTVERGGNCEAPKEPATVTEYIKLLAISIEASNKEMEGIIDTVRSVIGDKYKLY